MSVESYMHRYAKAVLASWLREWAVRADNLGFHCDEFRAWAPFSWRVNRGGPHFGVWEEWPIWGDHGTCVVWDETQWPWAAAGLTPPSLYDSHEERVATDSDRACEALLNRRPPTYRECVQIGMPPSVILDVAVQHKGILGLGFEVVHRHDVTPEKLERLRTLFRHGTEIYRVPASWILAQVGMPKRFVGERIV